MPDDMTDEIIQLMRLADLGRLRKELLKLEKDKAFMTQLRKLFTKSKR